jgi:hypothetical protein
VPGLSPRFFQSDYCQKELKAFIEANGLASGSAHRSRILPAKLLCSAPRDHPLAQVQAASFCTERDDDIPFEHQPGTVKYKEALRKLADAIAHVLKAVPSKRQRRAALYLAPDFKPSSDKLRASLEHHFDVLPENPTCSSRAMRARASPTPTLWRPTLRGDAHRAHGFHHFVYQGVAYKRLLKEKPFR